MIYSCKKFEETETCWRSFYFGIGHPRTNKEKSSVHKQQMLPQQVWFKLVNDVLAGKPSIIVIIWPGASDLLRRSVERVGGGPEEPEISDKARLQLFNLDVGRLFLGQGRVVAKGTLKDSGWLRRRLSWQC